MKRDILDSKIFDSRIKTDNIGFTERWAGYFLGPFSVVLINSILNNYLNVYYTDVAGLGSIWGGWFLSSFPIVVKLLDAFTFIVMGLIVDRFYSRQGKARPWILFSAPLLIVSMILLFTIPSGSAALTAIWIFFSYNLFYSIAYTAYNTGHTLMVPLSTNNQTERAKLSVMTNSQSMLSGMIVAVMFPTFIVPAMGVEQAKWIKLMTGIALAAFPFILLEYYFTRERVTESSRSGKSAAACDNNGLSLAQQFKTCAKSRKWLCFMAYITLIHLANNLSHSATFYYCNWVLGSYNDGYTQALFFAVGNGALGPGLFLCRPICKRLGRERAMELGFILSAVGVLICLLSPRSLPIVLAGQVIKSVGLIPSTFMVTAMMGDAMDDVERVNGIRLDGFSSSAVNVIYTLTTGFSLCILNGGLSLFGYLAPALTGSIPIQNSAVQSFLIFTVIGTGLICYPLAALLMKLSRSVK